MVFASKKSGPPGTEGTAGSGGLARPTQAKMPCRPELDFLGMVEEQLGEWEMTEMVNFNGEFQW